MQCRCATVAFSLFGLSHPELLGGLGDIKDAVTDIFMARLPIRPEAVLTSP